MIITLQQTMFLSQPEAFTKTYCSLHPNDRTLKNTYGLFFNIQSTLNFLINLKNQTHNIAIMIDLANNFTLYFNFNLRVMWILLMVINIGHPGGAQLRSSTSTAWLARATPRSLFLTRTPALTPATLLLLLRQK